MAFAAALSEHPLATQATGEVLGDLLETLGPHPDLVTVFATGTHAGALQDITGAIHAVLRPLAVIGCAAESVIGPHHEVEQGPGVAVLAGTVGPLVPVALSTTPNPATADGIAVGGWPARLPFEPRTLLLISDPHTFATGPFLSWLARRHPALTVVGGMASGARGAGASRLVSGAAIHDGGAVGVILGPSVCVTGAVSPGSRAFGDPLVVTGVTGNVITELSGRSPLQCLVHEAAACLTPEEANRLDDGGLQLGRLLDGPASSGGDGPIGSSDDGLLVQRVLGADRRSGAIAVDDDIPLGATVRFHVRDASVADLGIRRSLAGRHAEAALLFTCRNRGTRLFSGRDHDVSALTGALGPVPVAGFFADGEIGPVAGRNAVHRSTAAVALLTEGCGDISTPGS